MAPQLFLLFALGVSVHRVSSQGLLPQQQLEYPKPFNFEYHSELEDGGNHYHSSSGDGSGKVVGSYGLVDIDGRQRIVDYEADEFGFRANVRSNEPGVVNSNPADVQITGADGPAIIDRPFVPAARPGVARPGVIRRPVGDNLLVRPHGVPDYAYGRQHAFEFGGVDDRFGNPGSRRFTVGTGRYDAAVLPEQHLGANRLGSADGYVPFRR